MDKENTIGVLNSESRTTDMAAFSYSELCFVIDHFYGMPGRSPLEDAIRNDGLDKALDSYKDGPTIKKLLKSTDMKEYIFGLNCLNMLLGDGGHTNLRVDYLIYDILAVDADNERGTWDQIGVRHNEQPRGNSASKTYVCKNPGTYQEFRLTVVNYNGSLSSFKIWMGWNLRLRIAELVINE